jgi:hypothetical protein
MSAKHTENTVFKYKTKTGFYSPTYSCAHLASGERSSELNSQPPWLVNQLEILSHRKSKDECYDPQNQTSKKARLYHPLFSLSLAIANHPDDSLVGTGSSQRLTST